MATINDLFKAVGKTVQGAASSVQSQVKTQAKVTDALKKTKKSVGDFVGKTPFKDIGTIAKIINSPTPPKVPVIQTGAGSTIGFTPSTTGVVSKSAPSITSYKSTKVAPVTPQEFGAGLVNAARGTGHLFGELAEGIQKPVQKGLAWGAKNVKTVLNARPDISIGGNKLPLPSVGEAAAFVNPVMAPAIGGMKLSSDFLGGQGFQKEADTYHFGNTLLTQGAELITNILLASKGAGMMTGNAFKGATGLLANKFVQGGISGGGFGAMSSALQNQENKDVAKNAAYFGLTGLASPATAMLPFAPIAKPAGDAAANYGATKLMGGSDEDARQNALVQGIFSALPYAARPMNSLRQLGASGKGFKEGFAQDPFQVPGEAKGTVMTSGGDLPSRLFNAFKGASNEQQKLLGTGVDGELPRRTATTVESNQAKNLDGKTRAFFKTMAGSNQVSKEVKQALSEADQTYTPEKFKLLDEAAEKAVTTNRDATLAYLLNGDRSNTAANNIIGGKGSGLDVKLMTNVERGGLDTSLGVSMVKKLQQEGKHELAADVGMSVARKLTKAGQDIAAARMMSSLSPEGMLITANRMINEVNDHISNPKLKVKLTGEEAEKLANIAKALSGEKDLSKQIKLLGERNQLLNSKVPVNLVKSFTRLHTMAQLWNAKTILIRNPLGNELMWRAEKLNDLIATPIDWARSKLTGTKRQVTFKSAAPGSFWDDLMIGAKAGWNGVELSNIHSKFELGSSATFTGKYNPLTYIEKSLGAALRGMDYASYKRGYNNRLGQTAYLQAINEGLSGKKAMARAKELYPKLDDLAQQVADEYGKYVTYQDDSMLAKSFSGLKRGLNRVGYQGFGLGEMITKYPKTPANLINRALAYSPAGIVKGMNDIITSMPALRSALNLNARIPMKTAGEIERTLSRAIIGTGITALGYHLSDVGILSGPDKRKAKKVSALERDMGDGRYRVNISALVRYIGSGFNNEEAQTKKGDMINSYDWALPLSLSVSMGASGQEFAEANRGKASIKGLFGKLGSEGVEVLSGGIGAVAEQPLVTGVKRLASGTDIMTTLQGIVTDIPASFTPTLLRQIKDATENTYYETKSDNAFTEALQKAQAKIPQGLLNLFGVPELPKAYTSTGDIQRPNKDLTKDPAWNFFDSFLNPSNTSKYSPDAAQEEAMRIFKETGDTEHLPKKFTDRSAQLYGKEFVFDTKQLSEIQRLAGSATRMLYDGVLKPNAGIKVEGKMTPYKDAPDHNKSTALGTRISDIYKYAKYSVLTPEEKAYLESNMTEAQLNDLKNLTKRVEKYFTSTP